MLSIALSLPLLLSGPAQAGPQTAIFGLEEHSGQDQLTEAVIQLGATEVRCWRTSASCVVEFSERPELSTLAAIPGLRYVEADALVPLVSTQVPGSVPGPGVDNPGSDGLSGGALPPPAPAPGTDLDGTTPCPDLWDLETIHLGEAWEAVGGTGTGAPVVAIQDGGFLITHVDLEDTYSGGLDYGDNDWDVGVEDSVSVPAHGTFIAGIIAGRDDNDEGRVGVIPTGELNYQKIADSSGSFYWSYAIAAMNDLADGDLGVRVLNYSIASSSTTSGFTDAVGALGEADILLVAAAGNCGAANCADANNDANPLYPANFTDDHVVSVAGSTQEDELNPYSHYGPGTVDLAAPGVSICSLGVDSDTDTYSAAGTSYAAPLVAGVAALVWEAHPDLRAYEVARVLRASAVETADLADKVQSGGRLDAERAVLTAVPRSGEPEALVVDQRGELLFDITNVGAEGEAQILVEHPDLLRGVGQSEGWTLTSLEPGDSVELFDAGSVTLDGHATLLEGTLEAHSEQTVAIELSGTELGSGTASVRLVARSTGADYLNSPYSAGSADSTGFLAWPLAFEVLAVDEVEDTALPTDSDPPEETDSGGTDGGEDDGSGDDGSSGPGTDDDGEPVACGCSAAAPDSAALWLILGGVLLMGRRRRGEQAR